MRVDLSRDVDMFSHMRDMVEDGVEDGPVEIWHNGQHCLTVPSLHHSALYSVVEEPYLRLVPYRPHPKASVGPRVQALLDARSMQKVAAT